MRTPGVIATSCSLPRQKLSRYIRPNRRGQRERDTEGPRMPDIEGSRSVAQLSQKRLRITTKRCGEFHDWSNTAWFMASNSDTRLPLSRRVTVSQENCIKLLLRSLDEH